MSFEKMNCDDEGCEYRRDALPWMDWRTALFGVTDKRPPSRQAAMQLSNPHLLLIRMFPYCTFPTQPLIVSVKPLDGSEFESRRHDASTIKATGLRCGIGSTVINSHDPPTFIACSDKTGTAAAS
ncbi:26S proteasome non-ATPase regulatory subunit 1 [Pseudozyma hubeiensis SY62]|uniref:26S proteasome non-ATPase regulatory subunit 1 n=1 Tax=Pseudozyma hubeiensis (strain SY62) TaxID=1305764 RepID=R9NWF7_PSEHS|nr:26S proteasome non-ATPase regulatory subunit 1 [Pseudozyma hubeiensis SY62]GAC92802.1 26S proteasome non-ATPase regulatory subunit 1 [Pseudozyma hubeiensis SY62]